MSRLSNYYQLSPSDLDRIVEMAWEDRTPFEAIEAQFGVPEKDVIKIMKQEMKLNSWKMWRKRVHQKSMKHLKKRSEAVERFKCTRQRSISHNKVSKR
ncbi:MAG: TIGR03643 family protein [Thermonemataceae bacterium]